MRLVVTLTKAGGTLRYTQKQQSAFNARKLSSLISNSLKSRQRSHHFALDMYSSRAASLGKEATSRGFRNNGIFGDGDWEQWEQKRTHLGGRLCLGVKLDDDFTNG